MYTKIWSTEHVLTVPFLLIRCLDVNKVGMCNICVHTARACTQCRLRGCLANCAWSVHVALHKVGYRRCSSNKMIAWERTGPLYTQIAGATAQQLVQLRPRRVQRAETMRSDAGYKARGNKCEPLTSLYGAPAWTKQRNPNAFLPFAPSACLGWPTPAVFSRTKGVLSVRSRRTSIRPLRFRPRQGTLSRASL